MNDWTHTVINQPRTNGCQWHPEIGLPRRCGQYPTVGRYMGARLCQEHFDEAIRRWGAENIQNRVVARKRVK